MEKPILRVMKRDILAKGNSSVATRVKCRYVPPAWRSKGPTFATLDGLRVHKAHNGCIRHQAKKHPGKSPGCVNEVHSVLRCPAALGVPAAVFSPQVSAVSAAASAGPVLASPPPEQEWFAADAASEEEEPVHSGSARAIIRLRRWRVVVSRRRRRTGTRHIGRIDGLRLRRPIRIRTIRSWLRTIVGPIIRLCRRRTVISPRGRRTGTRHIGRIDRLGLRRPIRLRTIRSWLRTIVGPIIRLCRWRTVISHWGRRTGTRHIGRIDRLGLRRPIVSGRFGGVRAGGVGMGRLLGGGGAGTRFGAG